MRGRSFLAEVATHFKRRKRTKEYQQTDRQKDGQMNGRKEGHSYGLVKKTEKTKKENGEEKGGIIKWPAKKAMGASF